MKRIPLMRVKAIPVDEDEAVVCIKSPNGTWVVYDMEFVIQTAANLFVYRETMKVVDGRKSYG